MGTKGAAITGTKATRRKRGHSQGEDPRPGSVIHGTLSDALKRFKADTQTDRCVVCGEFGGTASMIQCEACEQHRHLKCCGIAAAYQEVGGALLRLVGWNCRDCRVNRMAKQSAVETGLLDLSEQVNKLNAADKARQAAINNTGPAAHRVDSDSAPSPSPTPTQGPGHQTQKPLTKSQVVTLVARTVNDKERRKKNVIVTGLRETTPEGDVRAFNNLCEQHLNTKPALSALGTKRLGKISENSNKHRRLLVHLESESAATDILRAARQLRQADDPHIAANIFINPDLSPEDQKAAFEKRKQRRSKDGDQNAAPVTAADGGSAMMDTTGPPGSKANPQVSVASSASTAPTLVAPRPGTSLHAGTTPWGGETAHQNTASFSHSHQTASQPQTIREIQHMHLTNLPHLSQVPHQTYQTPPISMAPTHMTSPQNSIPAQTNVHLPVASSNMQNAPNSNYMYPASYTLAMPIGPNHSQVAYHNQQDLAMHISPPYNHTAYHNQQDPPQSFQPFRAAYTPGPTQPPVYS